MSPRPLCQTCDATNTALRDEIRAVVPIDHRNPLATPSRIAIRTWQPCADCTGQGDLPDDGRDTAAPTPHDVYCRVRADGGTIAHARAEAAARSARIDAARRRQEPTA